MNGKDLIMAMGDVKDFYVEEAAGEAEEMLLEKRHIPRIAAACVLGLTVCGAGVLTFLSLSTWGQGGAESGEDTRFGGGDAAKMAALYEQDWDEYRLNSYGLKADVEGDLAYPDWGKPLNELVLSGRFGVLENGYFSDHVNFAGEKGEDVFAVCDAAVLETGYEKVHGNYVILKVGDDVKIRYGHLKEICVGEDDDVKKGEKIATLGQSGMATGPNLSFTLYVNGEAVDPLQRIAE